MFKYYRKTIGVALVALGWLWSISAALAAISSKSDLGVALGVAGVVTASFLSIWLLELILRKRGNNGKNQNEPSTGGSSIGGGQSQ